SVGAAGTGSTGRAFRWIWGTGLRGQAFRGGRVARFRSGSLMALRGLRTRNRAGGRLESGTAEGVDNGVDKKESARRDDDQQEAAAARATESPHGAAPFSVFVLSS